MKLLVRFRTIAKRKSRLGVRNLVNAQNTVNKISGMESGGGKKFLRKRNTANARLREDVFAL